MAFGCDETEWRRAKRPCAACGCWQATKMGRGRIRDPEVVKMLEAMQKEAANKMITGKMKQENAIDEVLHEDRCQVVACTLAGAGDRSLVGKEFAIVCVDEATQATEPATLIALTRPGLRKVVLVRPSRRPVSRTSPCVGNGKGCVW